MADSAYKRHNAAPAKFQPSVVVVWGSSPMTDIVENSVPAFDASLGKPTPGPSETVDSQDVQVPLTPPIPTSYSMSGYPTPKEILVGTPYPNWSKTTAALTSIGPYTSDWAAKPSASTVVEPSPASSSPKHNGPPSAAIAAAATIPALVFGILAFLLFLYMRRRKSRRQGQKIAHKQAEEMRIENDSFSFPPNSSTIPVPLSSTARSVTALPIVEGSFVRRPNGAYFSGIDTSDMVSMESRTGLGNPFADPVDQQDEPPPPYRPRSIAQLSRGTSQRTSEARSSRADTLDSFEENEPSPFVDAGFDDDAISTISEPTPAEGRDQMSDVSDLSYQEDRSVAISRV
ncbi:hypothetical protein GQ43DRAFT_466850 [Delitschia confertaspora ATCC 74209]|uniref:Uncharacterized protein n=1 Tax=Delitschia confertaspora ATCC 74209 TaxID=1513339 RepID=A0A9P4JGM9_9PLEO|nr:hypothetical protein GQ43DRAFT_466850 [Delitschia confertaspora ATCC 74209]